jgi:hypothetical protein
VSRSEEPRLARQVQGQVLDIRNLPRFFSSRIGLNAYLAKMKLRKKIKENESLQKAFEKAKESAWDILTYRPYTARDLLTISFAKKRAGRHFIAAKEDDRDVFGNR